MTPPNVQWIPISFRVKASVIQLACEMVSAAPFSVNSPISHPRVITVLRGSFQNKPAAAWHEAFTAQNAFPSWVTRPPALSAPLPWHIFAPVSLSPSGRSCPLPLKSQQSTPGPCLIFLQIIISAGKTMHSSYLSVLITQTP